MKTDTAAVFLLFVLVNPKEMLTFPLGIIKISCNTDVDRLIYSKILQFHLPLEIFHGVLFFENHISFPTSSGRVSETGRN